MKFTWVIGLKVKSWVAYEEKATTSHKWKYLDQDFGPTNDLHQVLYESDCKIQR